MMMEHNHTLTEAERLDWLRLYRSENVGPVTFFRLLEQFGSAGRALQALPDLARRGGGKTLRLPPRAETERELAALHKLGARLLCAAEPDFPAALRAAETAPLLTVRGHAHLLRRPMVAVVGGRNASVAGQRLAEGLARDLGQGGLLVVSGMARGIDSAAHRGALATGTVAVLAGGVDVIYPPENRPLYERMVAEGAVLSEMPPGTQPQAAHFPRRNRLISGLAAGLVVVEASLKSGSLITARLALEQGREIFAVPGSPLDPRSLGGNSLIKQGAALVENAADILTPLADLLRQPLREPAGQGARPVPPPPDGAVLDQARRRLLAALSPTPVAHDDLLRDEGLAPGVLSLLLLELDLAGRLERHPGNRLSLLPER
ncbi:hypothetical protein GALL_266470 [mine drainage metagenome]|uniref:Uncharacterized protein n=1 Tax=mine drainage metagenome TaxID=410659 RepID=A0A1J5R7V0_9ZZZZ